MQPKGLGKEKVKGRKEKQVTVTRAAKVSKQDHPTLDKEVVQVQAGTNHEIKSKPSGSGSPPIEEIEVNPTTIVVRGVSLLSTRLKDLLAWCGRSEQSHLFDNRGEQFYLMLQLPSGFTMDLFMKLTPEVQTELIKAQGAAVERAQRALEHKQRTEDIKTLAEIVGMGKSE